MENMNKKGYFTSVGYLILIFFLIMLAISLVVYQNNPNATPENFNNITWHNLNQTSNSTLNLLTYKFVNFIGESAFIINNEVTTWGYYNKNIISGQTLMYLIILFLLAPLIYPVFIIIVSIILIIREWYLKRKEKECY